MQFNRASFQVRNLTTSSLSLIWFIVLAVTIAVTSYGQSTGVVQQLSRPGLPLFIDHFTASDYRGMSQNWAVVQDDEGLIYVGNRQGVLVYDTAEWKTISIPNGSTVRSLALGEDGRVYVGAQGELGVLVEDDAGEKQFSSLSIHLPDSLRGFDHDIWGTHAVGSDIFFQTRNAIFRWTGDRLEIVATSESFRTSFGVGETLFVRDSDRGLLHYRDGNLRLAPDGARFVNAQVFIMGEVNGRLIVGTRELGMLELIDGVFQSFGDEINDWLADKRLYSGAITNDKILVGTLGDGVAVADLNGNILDVLDENFGLPDGWINYVYVDRQMGAWLALHNRGIVRFDLSSALTVFDERQNLSGIVSGLSRDKSGLVVSTFGGVFRLRSPEGGRYYRSMEDLGIRGGAYFYVEVEDILAMGAPGGLYYGRNLDFREENSTHSYAASDDGCQLFVGTIRGVRVVHVCVDEPWHEDVPNIVDDIRSLVLSGDGHVWARSRTGTLYSIIRDGNSFHSNRYASIEGLPAADYLLVGYEGSIGLVSANDVFRLSKYGAEGPVFSQDERFYTGPLAPLGDLVSLFEDEKGRVWLVRSSRIDVLTIGLEGGFEVESPPLLDLNTWNLSQVFVDDDGIVWISNEHKLYRYDPSIADDSSYEIDVPPILKQITLVESESRLPARSPQSASAETLPRVEHANNAIRFDFALPSYNNPEGNTYQFKMEGHDRDWSEWSASTHKSYTNLREGTYRFRVRGMNAQGRISPETVYVFRVLPPWYRTIWAYFAYLLLFGVAVAFAVQYRRMVISHRKALAQARELERERSVNERLQESYTRLQEANESLLQADKLKDEFLANTSHELRTPLTAILGFASILKDEVSGEHKEFMGMIEENGKRLLHTLNSLLDLAKLRVGMMETDMRPVDVTAVAHDVCKLMQPLAKKRDIGLDVRTPSSGLYSLLDTHCAERVLYNLVGNAIKFTDDGHVSVVVEEENDEIVITVRDTGIGIEPEFIPQLFDEFRQESSGLTREHEGSGLGLAITNRLVMLMNGSISVSSEKGEGSTFAVRFPKYHQPTAPEGDGSATAAELVADRSE